MSNKTKNIFFTILPIALGVFLVWWLYTGLQKNGLEDILIQLKNANYFWIFLSLFFGVLSHLSRAYRWKFLLEPLGYNPRFLNSVFTIFTSYIVNLTVPRAGEIVRVTGISNYENIPFDKAFGTVVAERVIDVVMLLLIIVIAFFYQFELLSSLLFSKIPNSPVFLIGLGLLLLALAGLFFYLIRKSKNIVFQKIRNFSIGIFEGLKSIFKMEKRGAFLFHTFFIWGMYLLMFYVASFAIPESANMPFGAVITGFVAGSLSMAATNGGLGSYPIGVQQALILYGIAANSALAFGLLMWTAQTLMVVVLGGLSFIALPLYNRNR